MRVLEDKKVLLMHASFHALTDLIIPEGVSDYFTLKDFTKKDQRIDIYLEELNEVPQEYAKDQLLSKGFYPSITLQDFPMRGHDVYLHIKRRRWLHPGTGKTVHRDWSLVAKGTRITEDFAAFLKAIGRYEST